MIDAIHGVLTRQAHSLRQWDPDNNPALALRQIRYDCSFAGVPDLVVAGPDEDGSPFRVEWNSGSGGTWLISHTLKSGGRGADAVAVSRDGKLVAVGGSSDGIHVYEVRTGAMIHSFPLAGFVRAVGFSKEGRKVLAQSATDGIQVWDLVSGERGVLTREDAESIDQVRIPDRAEGLRGRHS